MGAFASGDLSSAAVTTMWSTYLRGTHGPAGARPGLSWIFCRGFGVSVLRKAATWGQNGGSKNVENLQECMEWLLASTQTQMTDDADADADDDADEDAGSADAVNDAGTDDTEY
eukprot:COSAG02_NODE_17313_length_1012_cov_91.611172_2_plen_114_part_00